MSNSELFAWTLKPGQETIIEIITKVASGNGMVTLERNRLILEPPFPVKISILSGPLSEVTIGRAIHG